MKISNKGYLKYLLASIAYIIFLSSSYAQTVEVKDTLNTSPKTLLWKIEGGDIKSPSYIFGTIHLIPADMYFFPEEFEKCLSETKELVLEIDMSNPIMLALELFSAAQMRGDTTLVDLYTEEEYDVVKTYFLENIDAIMPDMGAMGFSMMQSWKPLLLSSMLYDASMEEEATAMTSYEMEIVALAEKKKLGLGGLESVAFQASIFDSIPYKTQADLLLESIKGLGDSTEIESYDDLFESYVSQDLNKMTAVMESQMTELDEYMDIMLSGRNHNWIPIIEEKIKNQSTFFAVGAGHLGGQEGVLNLLYKKGYSITPIMAR